jgi:hypothetical protein
MSTENVAIKIEAVDHLALKEAGTVILKILGSKQDQGTIVVALKTLAKMVGSNQQTNITNCTIGMDCDKVLKDLVLDGNGNIDDRFEDLDDIEEIE